jgi:hypothetical protein
MHPRSNVHFPSFELIPVWKSWWKFWTGDQKNWHGSENLATILKNVHALTQRQNFGWDLNRPYKPEQGYLVYDFLKWKYLVFWLRP